MSRAALAQLLRGLVPSNGPSIGARLRTDIGLPEDEACRKKLLLDPPEEARRGPPYDDVC